MKDPNRRRPARGLIVPPLRFHAWKDKDKSSPTRPSRRSPCPKLAVVFCFTVAVFLSAFHFLRVSFHPVLVATWQHRASVLHAVTTSPGGDGGSQPTATGGPHNLHAVAFPDHFLLFQNYPPQPLEFTPTCHYPPSLQLPPLSLDVSPSLLLLQCPVHPSLRISPPPYLRWDCLTYAAYLDRSDNSTIAFAKGLNLRPERLSNASRYQCVFGFHFLFDKPKLVFPSDAVSVAQEIVRCRTPLSVVRRISNHPIGDILVSVRVKGRGGLTLPSIASPTPVDHPPPPELRRHRMCVCTMVRNQARFLREWVMYNSRLGVERWFIYDNNSNDSLPDAVRRLVGEGFKISRHPWPWIKTQEAGFAHCALQARSSCEWVGFLDVDEFLHLPATTTLTLADVLANHSTNFPSVGELRTSCYSFGPSGHTTAPAEGVMVGYTCRMATPERHKSIVRPDALSPSLINVVHHFHLREGYQYVNMDRSVMVINHYKYQVWEVFKEKFYRRVATYVADWLEEENVGSKDRAPGIGTKAVEPPNWPDRFCEVWDDGLKNWVVAEFADPLTGRLPWS